MLYRTMLVAKLLLIPPWRLFICGSKINRGTNTTCSGCWPTKELCRQCSNAMRCCGPPANLSGFCEAFKGGQVPEIVRAVEGVAEQLGQHHRQR